MSKRNKLPRKGGPQRDAGRDTRGDMSRHRRPAPAEGHPRADSPAAAGGAYWIYGSHAVKAALANLRRHVQRLLLVPESDEGRNILALSARELSDPRGMLGVESAGRSEIARLLPEGAVHQGMAALVQPLPQIHLEEVCDRAASQDQATVVVLDQVTDPHNVGAILRSAAAFGALAVVLTDRNAPPETGALAKSASGALEAIPLIRVTNLVRALDLLKQAGFWCAGLAADGPQTLAEARLTGRVALVCGSEGEGLRRLTRERCDLLVRLPTQGPIGHLNVSNAAAVALYAARRG